MRKWRQMKISFRYQPNVIAVTSRPNSYLNTAKKEQLLDSEHMITSHEVPDMNVAKESKIRKHRLARKKPNRIILPLMFENGETWLPATSRSAIL